MPPSDRAPFTTRARSSASSGASRSTSRPRVSGPRRRVALATIVSLVGSLALDALLVAIGTAIFTSTKHYGHFRLSDYGKLTIIGVLIVCAAWPVVTWISSAPRWLFFRLAILVTLFLWLPDFYILVRGQPANAVTVLMCMHVAIAFVTYNALVNIAPGTTGGSKASPVVSRAPQP